MYTKWIKYISVMMRVLHISTKIPIMLNISLYILCQNTTNVACNLIILFYELKKVFLNAVKHQLLLSLSVSFTYYCVWMKIDQESVLLILLILN